MAYERILVRENIYHLQQGIELMERMGDELYRRNDPARFGSGPGKHFRHILDHYLSFIGGLQGEIDYDARERDARLEEDCVYAMGKSREIIAGLEKLLDQPQILQRAVQVISNEGEEAGNGAPGSQSTLKRELQFLLSHTVHHYALIALILRIQGFETPKEFGVAPSTLKYQKSLAEECAP